MKKIIKFISLALCFYVISIYILSVVIKPQTEPKDDYRWLVFQLLDHDYQQLKNGVGDQEMLKRQLNAESNYLIGLPPKDKNE